MSSHARRDYSVPTGMPRLMSRASWRVVAVAVAVFAVTALVHGFSTVSNAGGDSYWSTFTARSLMVDHNLELSEYGDVITPTSPNLIHVHRGGRDEIYNFFPYGTSIMAMPLMVVADGWFHLHGTNIDRYLHENPIPKGLEHFTASVFTGLAAAMLFVLGVLVLGARRWFVALAAALVFAFGTAAWSSASRALWMHGPTMFLIATALCLAVAARENPRWLWALGPVVAMSYVVRPTNAVVVVAFTALVIWQWRRHILRYLAGAAVVAVAFAGLNLHSFGSLLPAYYQANRLFKDADLPTALGGNLVSPARGLLVYSPVLLLAIAGVVLQLRRRALRPLDVASVAAVLGQWFVISAYYQWWGGWTYGPRLFSDAIPFLVYLSLPALDALFVVPARRFLPLFAAAACATTLAVGWSVWVNWRGATKFSTLEWDFKPTNVDFHTDRLWDWNDPQFLR